MSEDTLPALEFDGHLIHMIEVSGRPAWVVRELGDAVGLGAGLASRIADEWGEDFVAGLDYAVVVGEALGTVLDRWEVPLSSPNGLLVLFESGMHLALAQLDTEPARKLRRVLVEQVLWRDDLALEPLDPRAIRLAFEDRRLRSRTLREAADDLLGLGQIDEGSWASCRIRACEIALGARVPELERAIEKDWLDLRAVSRTFELPATGILEIAHRLGLLGRPAHARPRSARVGDVWNLTWCFSPEAVAILDAWLAEQGNPPPRKVA